MISNVRFLEIVFASMFFLLTAQSLPAQGSPAQEKIVWLDKLDITKTFQGWGEPQKNKSVEGNLISIGGVKHERGLGTHAYSTLIINLAGGSTRFSSFVGVDDEMKNSAASVNFKIYGDGKLLWESGLMKNGEQAKKVDISVKDIKILKLLVTEGGDGINADHADWADAKFEVVGAKPETIFLLVQKPYILTPPPSAEPRINGPKVFGVRPGAPFFYKIPATGSRPMEFFAEGLPKGLNLGPITGMITGKLVEKNTYAVILKAKNALGETKRELRIVVGDKICLTPPMGWNSFNCWGGKVDEAKIRESAKAMAESGLMNHGWTYINIDDAWQGTRGGKYNAIQGNEKFPDMKGLCDYVHSLGLKIGIYSTPWITSYAGYIGGSSDNEDGFWTKSEENKKSLGKYTFEQNDAKQWAEWGIDYLKYDWGPIDVTHTEKMANALKKSGRDIIFSLSNGASFTLAGKWAELANCWRTTGDIVDTWRSVFSIGFFQDKWAEFAGPGHWNDPDMLVVGVVGWGNPRPSRLTPDEQYTHISHWCLLSAPLLLGCDLAQLDEFTLNLLTNDEVLEINQDSLARQAKRIAITEDCEVWAKDLEDGSKAVGLFNLGDLENKVEVKWSDMGIEGPQKIRDLWRQKELGIFENKFEAKVPVHGVLLIRITP